MSSAGVFFARPLVGSRWTAGQGPLAQKTPTLLDLPPCARNDIHFGAVMSRLFGTGQLIDDVDDSVDVAGDRQRVLRVGLVFDRPL